MDLSHAAALTDAGLAAIAEWSPPELLLAGAGAAIGDAGFAALAGAARLVRLDLSRWPLDAGRVRALAARSDLEELVLARCGLDDPAVAVLAGTASPLRVLSLRDNPAVTAAGLAAVAARPGLAELDVRGLDAVDDGALAALQQRCPELRLVR